jgi:diadenosine tetraphosphate (Ap4A) HIT family hydrolase
VWVDEHWRVQAPLQRSAAPVQLFLETREHLDLHDLDEERAAEMGRMIVRLDRAIHAVGGIGRVHVNRWGDGGSHFHLWFYGRPVGDTQMIGFSLPLWAMTLPPTPEDEWNRNLTIVAAELEKNGGRAMV